MKKIVALLLLSIAMGCGNQSKTTKDFTTVFESSDGLETATYAQIIHYYKSLADTYDEFSLFSFGQTDSGEPLHLLIFDTDREFTIFRI